MKRFVSLCAAIFILVADALLPAQSPVVPLPEHAVARLGTTRFRHAGGTTCVAFIDGGKALLTAGNDQAIRVWDVKTGAELRVMQPPPPVKGSVLADNPLPRQPTFFRINVSANGTRAVGMDYHDGKMRLWDVTTGKLVREQKIQVRQELGFLEFEQCILSPDGKQMAVLSRDSNEKTHLSIVDADTGKALLAPVVGKSGALMRAAYSPDGKTIAWSGFEGDKDCIRLIDLTTGKERGRSEVPHSGVPDCYVFTPDSRTLVCGGIDGIRLIDANNGKDGREITSRTLALMMAMHPDGKRVFLASGPGRVSLFDLDSGKILRRFGSRRSSTGIVERNDAGGVPPLLAISPDGKTLAVAGDDAYVRLYDLATGKELSASGEHTAAIRLLRFSKDGRTIVSGGGEGTIQTWDAAAAQRKASTRIRTGEGGAVALSPDNQLVVSTRNENLEWRTFSGNKRVHVMRPDANSGFAAAAFTPDGKRLLSIEYSQTARARLIDVATKKEVRSIPLDQNADFESLLTMGGLFSPCSRWMTMSSAESNLDLIDLETGKSWRQIAIPEEFVPLGICYSPDSRTVLMQFGEEQLALYEVATGQLRRFIGKRESGIDNFDAFDFDDLLMNDLDVWDGTPPIAVSPDFRLAALAQFDGKVGIWNITQGKRIALLQGHRGRVRCLTFSADGKRLASGSTDTTILLWDVMKFAEPLKPAVPITADEFNSQWKLLLGGDPELAFVAIEQLSQPGALRWLAAELLKPPPTLDQVKTTQWLEDLDNPRYAIREKATTELSRLGDEVVPYLHKAIAAKPSAEAARRLRDLLDKTDPYNLRGEKLRQWRALEVVERIRTPEAGELLRKLAAGPPERLLTREAQIALKRGE